MKTLITGASSGIGREFAYQFAEMKKDLILVSRNKERLNEIKNDIEKKYKVKCEYIICDLSKEKEINNLTKIIKNEKIETVVNNAGFGESYSFTKTKTEDVTNMINVHVLATTLISRAVITQMSLRKKGTIINVSSIAGFLISLKTNIIYNSTKRYILHFSRNLQEEVKDKNIKVQALCPGYTRTNFNFKKINEKRYRPDFLFMEPREVVLKSIKALSKRKVVLIPGFLNKFIVFLFKHGFYK
jgi:uncharacterized protein